jgi:hypothetical protein
MRSPFVCAAGPYIRADEICILGLRSSLILHNWSCEQPPLGAAHEVHRSIVLRIVRGRSWYQVNFVRLAVFADKVPQKAEKQHLYARALPELCPAYQPGVLFGSISSAYLASELLDHDCDKRESFGQQSVVRSDGVTG